MDPIDSFKDMQRKAWSHFAPFEMLTTAPAGRLTAFAGINRGQKVLDVACGTGVVALTAARLGADVSGLDLTPELLERARANSGIAAVSVDWREGDTEKLPWDDRTFDVVVSQFGHMFAPRPDVAIAEMLRVLKPGGTIAFATWPPDLFTGRMFVLVAGYLPPPPSGVIPPVQWGVPSIVRERLGAAVRDITFDTGTMLSPSLSPQHFRDFAERGAGPVMRLMGMLREDPAKLAKFRSEFDALISLYFGENTVRQDYLLTRAVKA
jgi:SAM-dependent methyltransferase